MPDPRPAYPAPPWRLQGQLWLSLLRLPSDATGVDGPRPAGLYGAAFVDYEPGSVLGYSELLVARPVRAGGRVPGLRASVTDIWVDSPASAAGGRALWAIPKLLCDFDLESVRRGPVTTTGWTASVDRRPVAEATFTDVSRAMVRLPFRGSTWQPGTEETGGAPRSAGVAGSGRALPCRGRWHFAADGPLAWLRDAGPVASFRLADFRMSFG